MILSAIAKASWTMIVVNGEAEGQLANRVFHKLDKTGNNANIGIRGFTVWKQKIPEKMLAQWGLNPGLWLTSRSKSNTLLSEQICQCYLGVL